MRKTRAQIEHERETRRQEEERKQKEGQVRVDAANARLKELCAEAAPRYTKPISAQAVGAQLMQLVRALSDRYRHMRFRVEFQSGNEYIHATPIAEEFVLDYYSSMLDEAGFQKKIEQRASEWVPLAELSAFAAGFSVGWRAERPAPKEPLYGPGTIPVPLGWLVR